ncbi:MAG: MMPL family transporter [Sedimentisphaerales bacterium]|nr:MMPL family transporter [Sedimentisphaerales bacterium]
MRLREWTTDLAMRHYKIITILMVLITLALGALIPRIQVDTDPENMLPADEAVRVFHNITKDNFNLNDLVVLGITNESDPCGVFNPNSLRNIYELTQFAKTLSWPTEDDPCVSEGVVTIDVIAPSMVDHVAHIAMEGQEGLTFSRLMPQPPETQAQADQIRRNVLSNPLLNGTMVSEDGKALCVYLPLDRKDLSYRLYTALREKIATLQGSDQYFITGLPVAEDTFGVEMFIQMAISAPAAMVVIFLLMLLFFRKLLLIISPMIVAMVSVISTMGLLIGFGYPVHIMSSMIPIFLMPIAVVDSVHILSEFFDRYTPQKGRRETMREVMSNLFVPMLYTSLTSAAGFASLALTPIPPVQVFGMFVAIGIMTAWVWTILFVPAYIMFVKESSLANFGAANHPHEQGTLLTRFLRQAGQWTYNYAKPILVVIVLIGAVAVYGITRIQINDNPVKWFAPSHPIRQADRVLNEHFAGTYMAYLILQADPCAAITDNYVTDLSQRLQQRANLIADEFPQSITNPVLDAAQNYLRQRAPQLQQQNADKAALVADLAAYAQNQADTAQGDDYYVWDRIDEWAGYEAQQLNEPFKDPALLNWMEALQNHLAATGVVGKTNSIVDIVKKVRQEFIDGRPESAVIPQRFEVVGAMFRQFLSSNRPQDLWHMVTSDYHSANIWVQLTSGDNKDMEQVVAAVDDFVTANPPPPQFRLQYHWAGLTYINTVWQNRMVTGMLQSFLGSFLVVFIMMSILFRSPLWGLICMIPLTVTILMIYGMIGLIGKDYDMPVAVLSALTLGMAVDFAIHFLQRSRETYLEKQSWKASVAEMFGEPALAITRNVLVIAIGFLPLLAAPLMPYKTVGIFLCAIMAVSGAITLLVLPAILRLGEKHLFKSLRQPQGLTCNCAFCAVVSAATVLLVALNMHQYSLVGWSRLAWISVIAIPLMALTCSLVSRRNACKTTKNEKQQQKGQSS